MRRTQKGKRVKLPAGFKANVAQRSPKYKLLEFDAVYMTWDHHVVYLAYAGDNAEESYTTFQLPLEPKTLRELAQQLLELADEHDD